MLFSLQNTLISVKEKYDFKSMMLLNKISILGIDRKPESVNLNGNAIHFEYIADIRKLSLDNIGIDLSSKLEILWK